MDIRPRPPVAVYVAPGDFGQQLAAHFQPNAGRPVRVPHSAVQNIVCAGFRLDLGHGFAAVGDCDF